jgi:hypothetical protein
MRTLHPQTINIASNNSIPKTVLSHAWAEVFKFYMSKQKHPKMFIDNDFLMGVYLKYIYLKSLKRGCNFDKDKIKSLPSNVLLGFNNYNTNLKQELLNTYFDDSYLFSDACSLYYKGINIFPDIYGNNWRKYVPVESIKEIKRQIDKTLLINN